MARKTIVLDEYKARKAETSALIVEAGGETFTIPPPPCWPDNFVDLARANDNVGLAKAILGGDEVYARWIAAGGTAALLLGLVQDEMGASMGES